MGDTQTGERGSRRTRDRFGACRGTCSHHSRRQRSRSTRPPRASLNSSASSRPRSSSASALSRPCGGRDGRSPLAPRGPDTATGRPCQPQQRARRKLHPRDHDGAHRRRHSPARRCVSSRVHATGNSSSSIRLEQARGVARAGARMRHPFASEWSSTGSTPRKGHAPFGCSPFATPSQVRDGAPHLAPRPAHTGLSAEPLHCAAPAQGSAYRMNAASGHRSGKHLAATR